ncbi:hypothetical protein B0H13DRAFT_2456349 [Mycena leptocephala]|nr:hypothetical protein B0H13DRAFT_2456349 [Mycena leptocephala]
MNVGVPLSRKTQSTSSSLHFAAPDHRYPPHHAARAASSTRAFDQTGAFSYLFTLVSHSLFLYLPSVSFSSAPPLFFGIPVLLPYTNSLHSNSTSARLRPPPPPQTIDSTRAPHTRRRASTHPLHTAPPTSLRALPPHRGRLQPNPSSLLEAHARGPLRLMTRTTDRMRSPRRDFGAHHRSHAGAVHHHWRCSSAAHTPQHISARARPRLSMYKPSRFASTSSHVGPLPIADAALVAFSPAAPVPHPSTAARAAWTATLLYASVSQDREALDAREPGLPETLAVFQGNTRRERYRNLYRLPCQAQLIGVGDAEARINLADLKYARSGVYGEKPQSRLVLTLVIRGNSVRREGIQRDETAIDGAQEERRAKQQLLRRMQVA